MDKRFFIGLIVIVCAACQKPWDKIEARQPVAQKTHEISPKQAKVDPDSIRVKPIEHAAFVTELDGTIVYVDPVDETDLYDGFPDPDLVLITYDNPNQTRSKTLEEILVDKTHLVAPESADLTLPREVIKRTAVLRKGQDTTLSGIRIKTPLNKNQKKNNGSNPLLNTKNSYILETEKGKIYISGFSEEDLEVQNIKDLELAFISMDFSKNYNLNKVVESVLKAKPKKVYPYIFKGAFTYSDVAIFKNSVETQNPDITVEVLNWYPDEAVTSF